MKNHKMKKTLEYKILKYLHDNENGKPISLDNFIENEDLLRRKVSELFREKKITKDSELSLSTGFSISGIKCMITTKGVKWLHDIKKENKSIFNNSNIIIGNNKGTQSFEKTYVKKNNTKHKMYPNKNPSIWEIIISFCVKFWWKILIPLAIGIVLILIKKGDIDIGL
jgi:ABC-type ATPase with predicted acetyltransferase domain